MMTKKEIRTLLKQKEKEFLAVDGFSQMESSSIWESVEHCPEFQSASTVLMYMSMPGEPITSSFIEKWKDSKRIALPVVVGKSLEIRQYLPDKTVKGYMGIEEPSGDSPVIDCSEIDIAIVPGIAFSKCDGGFVRLGHGGGFYDRLLPHLKCPMIGVGYSFRLLDCIPSDPWDCILSKVIVGH